MSWTVGDTKPAFAGTLLDDGSPWPIPVGAVLTVRIRRPDGTLLSKTATPVDGPNGTYSSALATDGSDFTVPGPHEWDVLATWAPNGRQTFPGEKPFRVRAPA